MSFLQFQFNFSRLYGKAKGRCTVCTVDDKLRYFVEPLQEEYSSTCDVFAAFNAAFAKLLWTLVILGIMTAGDCDLSRA